MRLCNKSTQKGIEFCRTILEPYEKIFPRTKYSLVVANNNRNDDDDENKDQLEEERKEEESREVANNYKRSFLLN
jgi:hypothetical protein